MSRHIITFGGIGGGLTRHGETENWAPLSGPEFMLTEWVLDITEL